MLFRSDHSASFLAVETFDGWVPMVNADAFELGAWDAPPRPLPQPEDFDQRVEDLGDFEDVEVHSRYSPRKESGR